jgi:Cys-rich protein (TIGR01571 family)
MEKHSFETEKHDDGFDIDVEQEAPIVAAIATAETVTVTAPVTLVEGATIEAMVDGISFMAVVPAGGVSEGEAFAVPYPSALSSGTNVHSRSPTWRGDLCDCCRGGCCMCFTAFMCPLIIHTQVMERLNLNLGGCRPRVGSNQRNRGGVVGTLGIFFTFALPIVFLYALIIHFLNTQFMQGLAVVYIMFYAVIIFVFVALVCTRKAFRQTYNLPATCCDTGGDNCCDDCCVTYFCSPCSALQMANHSHDRKIHSYSLCSRTGLRNHHSAAMSGARNTNTEIV